MRSIISIIFLFFCVNSFAQSRVINQENLENNTSNTTSPFNKLVWSDEFDGYGLVNSVNWFHQTQLPNGISWYNS